mmetsp:Transcript_15043/g.38043  ORF Transcript_15043/g.38043 Transcript_15043/m.38043 type:complete len:206 (-) Transcript_15043:233-850(-)
MTEFGTGGPVVSERILLQESCRLRTKHISLLLQEERILLEDKALLTEITVLRQKMVACMRQTTTLLRKSLDRRKLELERLTEKTKRVACSTVLTSSSGETCEQTCSQQNAEGIHTGAQEESSSNDNTDELIEANMKALEAGRQCIEKTEVKLTENNNKIDSIRSNMREISFIVEGYEQAITSFSLAEPILPVQVVTTMPGTTPCL